MYPWGDGPQHMATFKQSLRYGHAYLTNHSWQSNPVTLTSWARVPAHPCLTVLAATSRGASSR